MVYSLKLYVVFFVDFRDKFRSFLYKVDLIFCFLLYRGNERNLVFKVNNNL